MKLSAMKMDVRGKSNSMNSRPLETTLASGNAVRQMQTAKNHGFEITLYYVALSDVELHVSRVATRVQAGGHSISEQVIRERYARSFENLAKALPLVDHAVFIDNSEELEVILHVNRGQISFEAPRLPDWTALVKEFLQK